MSVRVRIAPSPTGDPHVGTIYIALFNMIFAKHHKGKFILRIEDTDQKRSKPEYEENIYHSMKWSGLMWDEGPDVGGPFGPYRQSERTEIYQKYAQKLLDEGKAYKCFATPKELQEMREIASKTGQRRGYDRRYRNLSPEEVQERESRGESFVVRLKVPLTGECVYEDAIKGRMTAPWADIDDQVLMKSDGMPTYHLANVVDDHLMQITHVIRGDEWMSSTPKHVLLYEAFGWNAPTFMHMPLLLGADGRKLSKRKNPTSVFYFRDAGYLPEALVNFLTLMGYSMPGDKEMYSLSEIIEEFDETRIGQSGAFFDMKKLEWLNQKYIINTIEEKDLWQRLKAWSFNDEFMQKLMPLCHTRIKTFSEFMELCDFFFIQNLAITKELLCPKKITEKQVAYLIQALIWKLEELEDWSGSSLEEAARQVSEVFGVHFKKVMIHILFASIMGKLQGPPLFDSVTILGKERVRARFLRAMEELGGISNKNLSSMKKAWDKQDGSSLMQDVS